MQRRGLLGVFRGILDILRGMLGIFRGMLGVLKGMLGVASTKALTRSTFAEQKRRKGLTIPATSSFRCKFFAVI